MQKSVSFFILLTFFLHLYAITPTETFTVTTDLSLTVNPINGADFPTAIVSYRDAIYYGYIDADFNGCIAKKAANGTVTTKIVTTGVSNDDNHSEICIAVDREGYIHWTGNMHQTPMVYYRSANPEDISSFNELNGNVANGGIFGPTAVSYGRFVTSRKGTLFYVSRQHVGLATHGWVPGIMSGNIQVYNTDTKTWSQLGSLNYAYTSVQGGTISGGMDADHQVKAVIWDNSGAGTKPNNGYQGYKIRIVFDKNNRMHIVWNVAKNPTATTVSDTHTHLMYAYSDDEGVTWKKSNGTTMTLPITTNNGEVVYVEDPAVNAQRMYNFCNIALTSTNQPILIQNSKGLNKMLAFKLTGTTWTEINSTLGATFPGELVIDDNGWMTMPGTTGDNHKRSNDDWASFNLYAGCPQNQMSYSLDYQYLYETGKTRYQYPLSSTTNVVKTISWQNSTPGQVDMPAITPISGTIFSGTTTAIISCNVAGATIRYTTDGSTPTETNGTIYTGPFNITSTCRVKAVAYKSGKVTSRWSCSNISISGSTTNPPTAPTGLNATNIASTSFTLSWTGSSDDFGVAGYDVYNNTTLLGATNGATTTINLSGLTANTNYTIIVKARDAEGNIASSTEKYITTSSSALPGLICYEPFNYSLASTNPVSGATVNGGNGLPASNVGGSPTGLGTGIRGTWSNSTVVGGLTYSNSGGILTTSANALQHTTSGQEYSPFLYRNMTTDPFIALRTSTTSGFGWVAAPTDLYISFLINVSTLDDAGIPRMSINLGSTPDRIYIAQLNEAGTSSWITYGSPNKKLGNATLNKVELIVVRLSFTSATTRKVDFWFNPTLGTALGLPVQTIDYTGLTAANNNLSSLSVRGGTNFTVDELRVGVTATDVMPFTANPTTDVKNPSVNFNVYQSLEGIILNLCNAKGLLTVNIFDIQGRKILTNEVDLNQKVLIKHKLKQGFYLVQVVNGSNSYSQKLIIK